MKLPSLLPACAILLTMPTTVLRSETPPPAEIITNARSQNSAQPPLTFNVDFPGGSLDRLIAAVAKVDGVTFSIVNSGDTLDFSKLELPAFSLRNVTVATVSGVLTTVLEARGYHLNTIGGATPNSMVAVVSRATPPPRTLMINGEFLSFQLTPFLTEQSVDDIIGAIRTAWELDPSHSPSELRLKFHPGTGLLLVSGPQEAIYMTQAVLGQLKRRPEPKPPAPPAPVAAPKP